MPTITQLKKRGFTIGWTEVCRCWFLDGRLVGLSVYEGWVQGERKGSIVFLSPRISARYIQLKGGLCRVLWEDIPVVEEKARRQIAERVANERVPA